MGSQCERHRDHESDRNRDQREHDVTPQRRPQHGAPVVSDPVGAEEMIVHDAARAAGTVVRDHGSGDAELHDRRRHHLDLASAASLESSCSSTSIVSSPSARPSPSTTRSGQVLCSFAIYKPAQMGGDAKLRREPLQQRVEFLGCDLPRYIGMTFEGGPMMRKWT